MEGAIVKLFAAVVEKEAVGGDDVAELGLAAPPAHTPAIVRRRDPYAAMSGSATLVAAVPMSAATATHTRRATARVVEGAEGDGEAARAGGALSAVR